MKESGMRRSGRNEQRKRIFEMHLHGKEDLKYYAGEEEGRGDTIR